MAHTHSEMAHGSSSQQKDSLMAWQHRLHKVTLEGPSLHPPLVDDRHRNNSPLRMQIRSALALHTCLLTPVASPGIGLAINYLPGPPLEVRVGYGLPSLVMLDQICCLVHVSVARVTSAQSNLEPPSLPHIF